MSSILIVAAIVSTISGITANKLDLRGTLRQQFGLVAFLEKNDTSSVCSPISALLPLGSLALGAHGCSLQELNKAIGVKNDVSFADDADRSIFLKNHLSGLIKDLEDLPGVTLNIANRLYVSDKKTLYTNYTEVAENILKSSTEKVNFKDVSTAAENINNWVSHKTNGMISKLLSPQSISPESSLLVVNAIYFAGKWENPFSDVGDGLFYSKGGSKTIPMMSKTSLYKYRSSNALSAQLVELPYVGNKCSFLIVYPSEVNGLQRVLNELKSKPELLDQELQEMFPKFTKLTMPKFKIESGWNLKALYKEVGLSSIFHTDKSRLTGIVKNEKLYVSEAIQKAVIEVNEIGTKAAASSVITGAAMSPQLPPELNINHPFLFYVIANSQQLFTGTYS